MRPTRSSRGMITTLYALAGAVLGFTLLSVVAVRPTGAADPVDLSPFDADTYPAIHVSHRAPTVIVADEPVDLEFDFACGYLTGSMRCRPEATVWIAYGDGAYVPMEATVVDRDSLFVHTVRVPAVDGSGSPLRYFIEVVDHAADVQVRDPSAGAYTPMVVDSATPISLTRPDAVPGDAVVSLTWGESSASVGLETGPERPNTGPEAIAVSDNGSRIAVLDGINERALVVDSSGEPNRIVETGVALGDLRVGNDGSLTILDTLGDRSDPASPARLYRFDPTGTRTSASNVYALFGVELVDDTTVRTLASLTLSGSDEAGYGLSRTEQRASIGGLELPVYFRHDGTVLVGDRTTGRAFALASSAGIGPVAAFERTQAGYVLVMTTTLGVDIVWFDSAGAVAQYQSVASGMWADFSPTGRTAVDGRGNVYIAGTFPDRFEVLKVAGVQR